MLSDLIGLEINGGEGGIRTLGTLTRTTVFETAPFNHSGTSPPVVRARLCPGARGTGPLVAGEGFYRTFSPARNPLVAPRRQGQGRHVRDENIAP